MPFCFLRNTDCSGTGGALRLIGLARVLAGILFCVLIHNPVPAFSAPPPESYSLTFAWNPSTSPDVAGYIFYYGAVSGDYTNSIVLGNVTNVTASGFSPGVTYYFAMTAYDGSGVESAFSQEISYEQALPGTLMQSQGLSGGQFTLTVSGPAGQAYDIEATEDFVTWTVVGTVTIDASGSQNFTDADAANFPQRFYRTLAQP